MNERYDEDRLDEIDDDFLGLDPGNDFTIDSLAGLLPDLSAEDIAPPPDAEQDDPVEGMGAWGGIPDYVRPWREAVNVAMEKVKSGATTEVGRCLQRTREYYNVAALYSAAKLSLAGAQKLGKAYEVGFDEVDQIPRGAIVYWIGPNSQYGHVGPSIGGGMCVSTDWPTGRFCKVNIAALARAWGYTHIFWSPLVNDVRVWAPHQWVAVESSRVPGIWEFVNDAGGRIRPNTSARVLDQREAGEKFFPQLAIKHEGVMWLKGQDDLWYRRADVEFVRHLREDEKR